jgi:hypothetical protein
MRVIARASIAALCVAGAGLFPSQPVTGQVTQSGALRGVAALDQLKQNGQYESLQAAMRQARFNVSLAGATPLGRAAWRAPNPAAGYNAYVTESGVSIAINDGSYVSLSLRSIGYGAALEAVTPGEVSGDKQSISLRREGGVQEWYVNGPDGLEQGFTLAEPPGERRPGAPLRLFLQVSEGWRAVASEDGRQVTLRGPDGHAVQYSKLSVRDNLGRNISARLTVAEEQVVIEVEDGEATYPLTIDPLFSIQQKLSAADGATADMFGVSVALDGDTVVVGSFWDDIGANLEQGSAYVFTRSGAVWTQQQKLTAGDSAAGDQFGLAVALRGDTVVIGAPFHGISGQEYQGAVYVFTRSGVVWTQQQKLTASDGVRNDGFGGAVALDGDTLAVGATGDDIGPNEGQGSAYVFKRNSGIWTEQQKLTATAGTMSEAFGGAVALDGDTVVVGALDNNFGSNFNKGSAYIFTRSGAVWTERQKLTASDGMEGDKFGSALALSGDTIAVGAAGDDIGAKIDQGSVYVFMRSDAVWTMSLKLTAVDGAAKDEFGVSVALSGDSLVVGARGDTIGANTNQGSAYVFTRIGAAWSHQQKLVTTDGNPFGYFGRAVSLSGNTVIVGAPQTHIGANFAQGSVSAFVRPSCPTFVFAPANLPNGSSGLPYQQLLTVGGGAGPYQFTLAGGALPLGISLTSSGLLSGTPTTPGNYHFTLNAIDLSSFCSGSRAYTITVDAPCSTLTIIPPSLPNGATGLPYSVTLTAAGGLAPYKFTAKGSLPPGLSLTSNGALSGSPTQAGHFNFTLGVIDARGCSGSRADSVLVKPIDVKIGVVSDRSKTN